MADNEGYIAKPSADCCLKGSIHKGEPRGLFETVHGVETYISSPQGKSNGNTLLYFPDVWGFFSNGFLIMDGFADAGYLVLGLDYFRGVSLLTIIVVDDNAEELDGIGPCLETPERSQRQIKSRFRLRSLEKEAYCFRRRNCARLGGSGQVSVRQASNKVCMCWVRLRNR